MGFDWQWQDDGALRAVTPVLPVIRDLGEGRAGFLNQLIAAFHGWSDRRNTGSRSITIGDGEPVMHDHMAEAIALSEELVFDHQWQTGDVVLVDNFTVMHGRGPFEGKRRALASLIG